MCHLVSGGAILFQTLPFVLSHASLNQSIIDFRKHTRTLSERKKAVKFFHISPRTTYNRSTKMLGHPSLDATYEVTPGCTTVRVNDNRLYC
jgi:hypothetical protein